MAASIEYTQSFSTTFVSSGLQTPYFWALDAASPNPGSKFIIKAVTVSCPTGFTATTTPTYSAAVILQTSATAGSGGSSIETVISQNNNVISSGPDILPLVDATYTPSTSIPGTSLVNQFICSKPCIGVTVNLTNAGATVYLVVTYSVIDGDNALVDNFQSLSGTGTVGLNTALTVSTTNTKILKSLIITIIESGSGGYVISPLTISNPGSTIDGYLSYGESVFPFSSTCYYAPFYVAPNATSTLGYDAETIGVGGIINYYVSWTENYI